MKRARRNDVNDLPDFKSPPSWKGEKRRTPPDPTREPRVGATIAAAGFVYLFSRLPRLTHEKKESVVENSGEKLMMQTSLNIVIS